MIPNLQFAFGITKLAPKSKQIDFSGLELVTKIWWSELVYTEQKSSLKICNDSLQYFDIITDVVYRHYKETNQSEIRFEKSGIALFK